jgi:hypothetical protein
VLSGLTLRMGAIENDQGVEHRERSGNHFCYWVSEGNTSGNGSDLSLCSPTSMARSVTILSTLNCYWTVSGTFGVGVHKKI